MLLHIVVVSELPVVKRQRQEDHEVKASLGYRGRFGLKTKNVRFLWNRCRIARKCVAYRYFSGVTISKDG